MKNKIRELADEANAWYPMGYPSGEGGDEAWQNLVIFEKEDLEKFAELIVQECVDTLLWHGCDDAVPYIEWMAKNKLGVK